MRYKRVIAVCAIVIMAAAFIVWTKARDNVSISTYGGNQQHSYNYEDKDFKELHKVVWKQPIGTETTSEVLLYKDYLVHCSSSEIICSSKSDGKELWRKKAKFPSVKPTPGVTLIPAVIREDVVYFPDNNTMLGVDIESGKEVWKYTCENATNSGIPAVDNKYIYFSSNDGRFQAVNLKNKKVKWSYKSLDQVLSPVIDNDTIYINTTTAIIALNTKDGKERWAYRGDWFAFSIRVDKNNLYANGQAINPRPDFIGAVAAFEKKTGKLLWIKKESNRVLQMALGKDNLICFIDGDSINLRVLDAKTGEKKTGPGKYAAYAASHISEINGSVIALYGDKNLRIIDPAHGKELSVLQIDCSVASAAVPDGSRIYFTGYNYEDKKTYLYCVE